MTESFQMLFSNILHTAMAMGLLTAALGVIHFIDTVLLHSALKQRLGVEKGRIDHRPSLWFHWRYCGSGNCGTVTTNSLN
jgi:hypothetical protein